MEYRVEQIARAAGIGVDTVRFYQGRGLLPPPERRGRVAIYSDQHLERLRRIRELNREGLKLEAIRRVLDADERAALKRSLLGALEEAEGARSYTAAELAAAAGVSELTLSVMARAHLLEPSASDEPPRYSHGDLLTVRAARELLEAGAPLEQLIPLAREHADHTREVAERAIELFDTHIRHKGTPDELPRDEVISALRRLLPATTALVALHFQRTLIERVRARLAERGDEALEAALEASESARIEVSWG